MFDSQTLQVISVAAIVGFGLYQAVLAYWIFSHGKQSAQSSREQHEETLQGAQQRHDEYMTALQHQHTEAMQSLREQRDQSQRQHEETMATFKSPPSGTEMEKRVADMEQIMAARLEQS